jgi:signal transduction histidine kinase
VQLSIVDDGAGFDLSTPAAAGHRLGLASMRERARAAGGKLDVTSGKATGTTVRVTLPAGDA